MKLYHLSAPGMSGRVVKIRTISGSEKDEASVAAARSCDPEGSNVEFQAMRMREC
jgi:hypothetical protein